MYKQKAIMITIPEPCNESWDEMKPNNCGRFCALCEKTVIDFTEMSDDEVVKIMMKPGTIPCGRFKETQLNRAMIVPDMKPSKPFYHFVSKIAASFLLLQTVCTSAFAQSQSQVSTTQSSVQKSDANNPAKSGLQTVNGTVIDEKGEPLIGASVRLKGTSIGTQTDIDGNFSIDVTGEKPELEISYPGYLQQTVTVTSNSQPYNVRLSYDNILTDVGITTYCGPPVSKTDYVGAADVISAKKIENTPVTDITKAIENAAPNFNIMSGQPSNNQTIRTGGAHSLNINNTSPLIVLNGKIYTGVITSIDPMSVATMQVLKGAEATSLYGAKGASGVIVITTKSYKTKKKNGFGILSGKSKKDNNK